MLISSVTFSYPLKTSEKQVNLEVLYLLAAINHLCLPRGAAEYDAEIKKNLCDSLTFLHCFFGCVRSSPPEVFL